MVSTELTDRLEQSFRRTHDLLQRLLDGMRQRRMQWASARPSTLAPSAELEQIARDLAVEETARDGTLRAILAELPAQAHVAKADLHLNTTRICAALPAPRAHRLRAAADRATLLARQVRVEVALGERLVRFTQRAQEGLLATAAGAADGAGAHGYDRHARSRSGFGPAGRAGTFVDGRM